MAMRKLAYVLFAIAISAAGAFAAKPKAKAKANAKAAKVEDTSQLHDQAVEALMMYDVDRADEILEDWQSKISKNKKNAETPQDLKAMQSKLLTMRNMLERVEQIVIVDSLSVDTAQFFTHYRLAADAGKIGGSAARTSYMPAAGREIFSTELNAETGKLQIVHAGILDDGSREESAAVDLALDGNGDTAFPFMLADGITLYFANNAEIDGALGGYDIYMTRRNDEGGFYEPTNMGMPYNSPGNDYMMAIDETTGLGWWATDRNAEDGKVTIYVFVPNETRQNYDPDRSDITDLAFISSVKATQPEEFDAQAKLSALNGVGVRETADTQLFKLSLGNGKIYTKLADFKSDEARKMMLQYINDVRGVEKQEAQLHTMRREYAEGNLTLSDSIAHAEQQLETSRNALLARRNSVIKLELKK
jgi:hypothetical protein